MLSLLETGFDFDRYKKVDNIQFDILSADEIEGQATCEVNSSKLSGDGSVYDEKMGVITNGEECVVCENNVEFCPGHFGYIKFAVMIVHPLMYKHTLNYLRCICYHCHRFLLSEDFMSMEGLLDYDKLERFDKIVEYVTKDMLCTHCNKNQPKYIFSKCESNLYMFYREKDHKLRIQPEAIYEIFIDIPPEDLILMGLSDNCHPTKLILKNFPVLPPASRPYTISDGKICDDDLTYKYIEIIKINNKLKKPLISENKKNQLITSLEFHIKTMFDNSKGKSKQTNGREIKCFKKRMCGKNGQIRKNLMGKRGDFTARTVITGDPTLSIEEVGIPIKIAENLTTPEIVNKINIDKMTKMMDEGKINKVIRKGVTLNLKYALESKLTYQESDGKWYKTDIKETDYIIRRTKKLSPNMYELMKQKPFIVLEGDILYRNRKKYPVRIPKKKYFPIKEGDVLERQLINDDYLLLNRQPTLHVGSMMSFKVKLMQKNTIRMPLAVTPSFNADFDGDEMNLFVPRSYESKMEMREIASVKSNMISAQSNNPNIVVIQDALLGSYMLTRPGNVIGKELFFQCIMTMDCVEEPLERLEDIVKIQEEYHKKTQCWCGVKRRVDNNRFDSCECKYNGQNLFSIAFPKDLHYRKENKASELQPTVIIYKGVLVEGVINKGIVGGSQTSLLLFLHHEYSSKTVVKFIDTITRFAGEYLTDRGFSVGLSDMIPKDTEFIGEEIRKHFFAAKSVTQTVKDPKLREIKINMALNKGKDIGQNISKKSLNDSNNLKAMVIAGSKGNYINISQIIGTIGQQTISGQRIQYTRSHEQRTLPHYERQLKAKTILKPTAKNVTEMFESQGFVTSSYIEGLNPKEFFFHAFGGREGLVDTAQKTAESGYIQRRIIKKMEDCKIHYDGSVRNAQNRIIQFSYGGDGLDPRKTMKMSKYKNPQICDVSRIVQRLETNGEF